MDADKTEDGKKIKIETFLFLLMFSGRNFSHPREIFFVSFNLIH